MPQEARVEASIHDEWGIAPHHFPTSTDEKTMRAGALKHTQSMPFFPREPPAVSRDIPAVTASSRPPPTSRHVRKNSKVAQLLGIAITPEKNNSNSGALPNYGGIMSPPLLPMEDDPFAGQPLGALILGSGNPASQTHATQLTSQHIPPLALLPPSAPVLTERPSAHTSTQHVHAPQHAHRPSVGSDAQRIPRSHARTGSAAVGVSARSRSNPPPISSVPDPVGPVSQPPSHPPSSANNREHESTSTHHTHQAGDLGPRVRDAAVTPRKRYQNKFDPAPTPVPRLKKAHSSVVLSRGPMPPLHAPKPLKLTGQPSVEILHVLAESINVEKKSQKAQTPTAPPPAIWPPAPVIRPIRTVMPPRAEQEAFRAAAIEADKAYRKVCNERGVSERVRSDRGREARRGDGERERRHRRAATENSRRHGGRREVEYRTMADYGYYPAGHLAGRT